jgi:dihydroxy-acid dehydratase
MADDKKRYRSYEWFGKPDRDSMVHRSWMKNQGLPHHLFDGRPVIGICNTYSEVTPCNAHFREIAERVKRGVLEASGFPLEFTERGPFAWNRAVAGVKCSKMTVLAVPGR